MPTPKQPDPHDDAEARPDGPWREEEKHRGAGTPRQDAGEAGEASTKGRPHDDRARTDGAAAEIARGGGSSDGSLDRPPPDPGTVVVGGIGATATDPEDPAAPRNPA